MLAQQQSEAVVSMLIFVLASHQPIFFQSCCFIAVTIAVILIEASLSGSVSR